jgi:hypothetical protein
LAKTSELFSFLSSLSLSLNLARWNALFPLFSFRDFRMYIGFLQVWSSFRSTVSPMKFRVTISYYCDLAGVRRMLSCLNFKWIFGARFCVMVCYFLSIAIVRFCRLFFWALFRIQSFEWVAHWIFYESDRWRRTLLLLSLVYFARTW